jgi:hypothetical protein
MEPQKCARYSKFLDAEELEEIMMEEESDEEEELMSSSNLLKKKGDIVTRMRGHLRVHWKDKRDVYLLTNMHTPLLDGNFRDEAGHAVKLHVVEDYDAHMGFVCKSDRMVNSYGIARRTWKWTKKLFFHLLRMTILNVYLLHKSK